jgi:hypothetical protein
LLVGATASRLRTAEAVLGTNPVAPTINPLGINRHLIATRVGASRQRVGGAASAELSYNPVASDSGQHDEPFDPAAALNVILHNCGSTV